VKIKIENMQKLSLICVCLMAAIIYTEARGIEMAQEKLIERLLDTRVVGGQDASPGFAPYQVSIQNTFGEHVCGGSIVNQYWILTAAHCMEWPKQYLKIVTGTINWTKPDAVYNVADVQVHCSHDKPMYHNDIALLKVDRPIVFNKNTQPVKLATIDNKAEGDQLILTGWGSTKLWGKTPDILQKINLKYLPNVKCQGAVRNSAWLGTSHICTLTKSGEGSCHGDSGGPLVDAKGIQYGVVNFGEPCAIGYPDVYANVAYFNDWIRTTIAGTKQC